MYINYKDFNKSWMNLDKNLNRYFKQKKLTKTKISLTRTSITKIKIKTNSFTT